MVHRDALCSYDLDLHLMTLINEPDDDILKMYQRSKNELAVSRLSKVRASDVTKVGVTRHGN